MQNLIKAVHPRYYQERGTVCYLAVNNAAGGATIRARITGKTLIQPGSHDGYTISYEQSEPPYDSVTDVVPADEIFLTLAEANAARANDNSLQIANVKRICSDPKGLVRYLLDNAALPDDERNAVIESAQAIGLY